LQQAAGLGFQAETPGFDLLIAQLVRDRIRADRIESVPTSKSDAGTGRIRSGLCGRRPPVPERLSREEQTARPDAGLLVRVSATPACRRSAFQIRKERDELERIYEATWLELENAIGSKAADAIRKSVEETTEAGAVQLELPLEKKRNVDLEGEAKCNQ
jgi:hypothetical protein